MAANEEQKDNDENVGGAKFGKVSAKRISSALSIMVPLMMKMVGEFIPPPHTPSTFGKACIDKGSVHHPAPRIVNPEF
jgi:hypothetical protein